MESQAGVLRALRLCVIRCAGASEPAAARFRRPKRYGFQPAPIPPEPGRLRWRTALPQKMNNGLFRADALAPGTRSHYMQA